VTSDENVETTSDMNTKTRSYKDLVVWQKGIELAKLAYRLTQSFPPEEKFGLTAQMRRAAISIPSNIAKGQARHTTGEFVQFISHAEGSVAELDTSLILSIELGFCREPAAGPAFEIIAELRRMLNVLRRKLAARE
jgi:four helix bundle protein